MERGYAIRHISLPAKALISLIRLYQRLISRFLGRRCRFYPTCSHYSIEALEKYGIIKGVPKILWRLARCNPFNPGGYDPVD